MFTLIVTETQIYEQYYYHIIEIMNKESKSECIKMIMYNELTSLEQMPGVY